MDRSARIRRRGRVPPEKVPSERESRRDARERSKGCGYFRRRRRWYRAQVQVQIVQEGMEHQVGSERGSREGLVALPRRLQFERCPIVRRRLGMALAQRAERRIVNGSPSEEPS
jgi:hypothetical protein